jgi:hypothetical protein
MRLATQALVGTLDHTPAPLTSDPASSTTAPPKRLQTHLTAPAPRDQDTRKNSLPNNVTDYELLGILGLSERQELRDWLSQDWVVDRIREYKSAVIDTFPAPRKHQWFKYLQHRIDVILDTIEYRGSKEYRRYAESPNAKTRQKAKEKQENMQLRYLGSPDKAGWSIDDHDIRFLVQIVADGQAPGKAWAGLKTNDAILRAWAVLRWLRVQYGTYDSVPKSVNLHTFGYTHEWRQFLGDLAGLN